MSRTPSQHPPRTGELFDDTHWSSKPWILTGPSSVWQETLGPASLAAKFGCWTKWSPWKSDHKLGRQICVVSSKGSCLPSTCFPYPSHLLDCDKRMVSELQPCWRQFSSGLLRTMMKRPQSLNKPSTCNGYVNKKSKHLSCWCHCSLGSACWSSWTHFKDEITEVWPRTHG